ncbi:MAG: hypothetical protein JSS99_14805 [Actinobacteria bacterium]|nr:hypothetical protein [Actinomycetota bacterium]
MPPSRSPLVAPCCPFLRGGPVVRDQHQITHPRPDSPVSRVPELLILLLAALLAAGALALGGGGGGATRVPRPAATVSPAHVRLIERRVEALRGLRFRRPVPVAVVSVAQARREGLADFDRGQPATQRRVGEELLKLLGLLPPGSDLRGIEGSVYGEQVAGYYDPRRKRLALVRGAGVDDVTLAHELTHALEDQYADLEKLGAGGGDDASTAQQALVEGSATYVMDRYAARWPSRAPLGDALAGMTQVTGATPLPQYVARTLVFPYFQGEAFVRALLSAGGGGWTLVNVAERARPPRTTAEILQPSRWLRAQQPVRVALRSAGAPWRRLTASTLGEEDLAALLTPSTGAGAARALTGGWRGGRYALWRRGPLPAAGCPAPCRARDVLVLAVRMRDASAARALGAALRAWSLRLPAGTATVVRVDGATVSAAVAPDRALAARLTR